MVGRIRRAMLKVLLGAASSVAGTPRVAYAPLSQDTQDMLRSWMGTKLNNPDPLMDQESPTNRAYLRGYGPTGRRETWYDPDTKRRCFSLEYHCAAAVGSYRGIVKNYGA